MLQGMRSAAKYIWIFVVVTFVGVFLFTGGFLDGPRGGGGGDIDVSVDMPKVETPAAPAAPAAPSTGGG